MQIRQSIFQSSLNTAHSGEYVYGTDLDAPYANGVNAILRSPLINISGAGRLSFWFHEDFPDWSGVQVSLVDEVGNTVFAFEEVLANVSNGWAQWSQSIPVTISTVRLQWQILTNLTEPNGDGFFLDDVMVD